MESTLAVQQVRGDGWSEGCGGVRGVVGSEMGSEG